MQGFNKDQNIYNNLTSACEPFINNLGCSLNEVDIDTKVGILILRN